MKEAAMELFMIGSVAGLGLGVLVTGFLAVGSYDRGYDEAQQKRKALRAELVARQTAAARTFQQPARKAS